MSPRHARPTRTRCRIFAAISRRSCRVLMPRRRRMPLWVWPMQVWAKRPLLSPKDKKLWPYIPLPKIHSRAPPKSRGWRRSTLYWGMPITRFPFSSACCRYRMAVRCFLLLRCYDSIRSGIKSATILAFRNWPRKRNRDVGKIFADSRHVALKKRSLFWLYRCFFEDYPRRVSGERTGSASEVTQHEFVGGQRLFGRYTLIKILGRGGMGIVWLAHDDELERNVALKFLPDLIIHDAAVLSDLKRETRRCLELTHKNIVRIYDFVHDERSGCISMEYIDGDTLSNLRCDKERKVFEAAELTEWMSQLCDALDYAHIIHRDLKPANLMVSQRGELKVSDFGIARSVGDSMSVITMAGGRSGTLSYMSPQQLEGERGTHLDDIYSLGASIYELLTSKPPFYVGNIDRQIREKIPPSMTERRKEFEIESAPIPAAWEESVAACLAKDPGRRPQSVTEIVRQLQLPSPEVRPLAVRSFSPRSKKRVLVVALASLCLLALAIGGWYFGIFKPAHVKVGPVAPVSTATAIPEKSIAVLPFENLSANQENAFFTDGVQDEILADLAKVADLKVISRTSVMLYKSGNPRNLREIGQQLGVAHVLEGSVQRAANRVRVMAQLIDARTDAHLWAQTYDRDLADVFAIQSEIAKTIANELQAKLSPAE